MIFIFAIVFTFFAILLALKGNKDSVRTISPSQNLFDAIEEYQWLAKARAEVEYQYKSGQIDQDAYIDKIVDFTDAAYRVQQDYGFSREDAIKHAEVLMPAHNENIK